MEVSVSIIPAKHWFGNALFRVEREFTLNNITVPAGFISDGATVPRWLTVIGVAILLFAFNSNQFAFILLGVIVSLIPVVFPKTNMYLPAAIVHDYLLCKNSVSRAEADKIFNECLYILGVKPFRRSAMYIAVRLFGLFKLGMRI